MKYTWLPLILSCLLLASCSHKYEQWYQKYSDFNQENQRNKSWFPDFISTDAYDLKNVSYLDPLCAFGSFSYVNTYSYDSFFSAANTDKIDFSTFKQKVEKHLRLRPDWFLNLNKISKDEIQTIRVDRFFIARHSVDKIIYFVVSN